MTAYGMGGVLMASAVALALSIRCVLATEYIVGDGYCTLGLWSPYSSCDYNAWAQQFQFFVGDSLIFNFNDLDSTVVHVTKADYDSCTITNPDYVIYDIPPVLVTFLSSGSAHYVSVIDGVCYQKLALNVSDVSTPTTSTPTDTQPTPSTGASHSQSSPPSSSSHSSSKIVKVVVGLVVAFFLLIVNVSLIVFCCSRRRRHQKLNPHGLPNEGAPVLHAHVQQQHVEMDFRGAPVTNNQYHG